MMKFALSPYRVTITTLTRKMVNTLPELHIKCALHTITGARKSPSGSKPSKPRRRNMKKHVPLLASVAVVLSFMTNTGALRASAADLEYYTLSPQQALALYGLTLTADYYTGSTTEQVTLEYIGSTVDLTTLNGYPTSGGELAYTSYWYANDQNGILNQTRYGETPYLIYRWNVAEIASAPNFAFSLRILHSVDITAYGFFTSVWWSRSSNAVVPGVNAGLSQYASSYTLYGDSIETVHTHGAYMARPNIGSEYGMMRTFVFPISVYNTAPNRLYYFGNDPANTFLGMTALAGSTQSGGDAVTVGTSDISIKLERPITQAQGYNGSTGEFYDFSEPAVYIMLQCPTLYGEYVLPPQNDGNIDLSQIESYLAEQNESLANISEESTVQTRQLIAILAQLQNIYSAIQASGFNPTLNPQAAQTLPALDWSAQQTAIQEGTITPEIVEDMTPAADMVTSNMNDILGASGLTLYAYGAIALCAAGWFLTRGRGG